MTAPVDVVDRYQNLRYEPCDTCGARSYVFATLPSGREVTYCGHHASKYWVKLNALAVKVSDYRWRIDLPDEPDD